MKANKFHFTRTHILVTGPGKLVTWLPGSATVIRRHCRILLCPGTPPGLKVLKVSKFFFYRFCRRINHYAALDLHVLRTKEREDKIKHDECQDDVQYFFHGCWDLIRAKVV